jgi:hypothetical protein
MKNTNREFRFGKNTVNQAGDRVTAAVTGI